MSYRMLEELQNRRKEKVAVFLTFENIVGMIVVFFPVFLSSSGLLFLIRAPLCAGAALLGVALTLEVQGLPIYEQLLWRVRGAIRLRMRGDSITPEDLSGAISHDAPERPLRLDGPIQAIERAVHVRGSHLLGAPIRPTRFDIQLVRTGHTAHGDVHADPRTD